MTTIVELWPSTSFGRETESDSFTAPYPGAWVAGGAGNGMHYINQSLWDAFEGGYWYVVHVLLVLLVLHVLPCKFNGLSRCGGSSCSMMCITLREAQTTHVALFFTHRPYLIQTPLALWGSVSAPGIFFLPFPARACFCPPFTKHSAPKKAGVM